MRIERNKGDHVLISTGSGHLSGSRASHRTPTGFGHSASIRSASESFIKLTRNPDLPRPARFVPTVKGENDVVI